MKGDTSKRGFGTRAVHAGQEPEPTTGAVAVPIFQTSTFVQPALDQIGRYDYARSLNPTREALEKQVSSLERGAGAQAFASGMAAITALMTLVRSDEHAVFSRNVYGGTYRLLTKVLDRYRIEASWVDTTDLDALRGAMKDTTRLVFLESPTNPMMEITDIAAASAIAHEHGAKVAVDNTFLSPYLQRPLELGADFVIHSTTKFLNGHSDSIGGVLISKDPKDVEWFHFVLKSSGGILSPFDSFLTMRGIKTLAVRMDRHERNTRAVVEALQAHAKVGKILYPGLPDFPGHEVHKAQASGFGAMVSFDVGSFAAAKAVLGGVEVYSLAESLGGVESLISHPASMTHASVPAERRTALGISEGLVRISVGIEDEADLLADLEGALDAI